MEAKAMWKKLVYFGYVIIFFIFLFSLLPGANGEGLFPHSDKAGHCFVYFLVSYWFCNLYPREAHKWFVLKFTLMGILIEYLQRMTGYRSFDYFDMLANFSGTLIAFLVAKKYSQIFKGLLKEHKP